MTAFIPYPQCLDPDSRHYGKTPDQMAAWWDKYVTDELAWLATREAAPDVPEPVNNDIWEAIQRDKTPLYIHIGDTPCND